MSRLFENHAEFLSTHRGTVTRLPDAFTIESDRPEFTYAVLGRDGSRSLLDRFKTIHLVPLVEPEARGEKESWNQALDDSRFAAKGGLSYMVLTRDVGSWPTNPEVKVQRISDEPGMSIFSHVQAAGFAQTQDDYDRWHPWLRAANFRNLGNPTQAFYVAFVAGTPVGTTLIVRKEGLAGIYAVTTLAQYRKQGIATTLMVRAIQDAVQAGDKQITLQVSAASYAESLYKKLGFETIFSAKVFSRP